MMSDVVRTCNIIISEFHCYLLDARGGRVCLSQR